ncbi:MAG: hypothetical protein FWF30_04120 [Coriobacteriia bacterium]|nr:hypothetical protein [Coriobacteriia bacterium]
MDTYFAQALLFSTASPLTGDNAFSLLPLLGVILGLGIIALIVALVIRPKRSRRRSTHGASGASSPERPAGERPSTARAAGAEKPPENHQGSHRQDAQDSSKKPKSD